MAIVSCSATLLLIVTVLFGPPTNPPVPRPKFVETLPIAIQFLIFNWLPLTTRTEPTKPPAKESLTLPWFLISALTIQF